MTELKDAPTWMHAALPISDDDKARLQPYIRNYITWNRFKGKVTREDSIKLLIMELEGKRRMLIVNRIKHRYNSLRHRDEMKELYESAVFIRKAPRKAILFPDP